ncbi:uncharacterized protein LOC120273141 [Dioscorea cayenensis subsp. rotundata]|uniref:Uncharacterized protein LOC120273141 n=1 Tax=Dioscorea cayennensis subsp. rotundata TaxID=55577 RepID=A0AB40CBC6_DIOCR|nr:uncharacterized protein LOC120273141 [Dioscorea cayenensis subsp. rotundata]
MRTDREWMYNRLVDGRRYINPEFLVGVETFVEYACHQPAFMDCDKIRCPCCKCQNRRYLLTDEVKLHLTRDGFVKDYYQWVCHGEPLDISNPMQTQCNSSFTGEVEGSNLYHNMVMGAIGSNFDPNYGENEEETPDPKTQRLYAMLQAADEPLWAGCSKHSQLSAMTRLLNIKSEFHMSEKCYDAILQLMNEALPTDNKLVGSFYETKKFAAELGLPCEKIHCCINGCMIYWNNDIIRRSCKFCDHPRYKNRQRASPRGKIDIPYQKMYYFPLTPRLQRLYASEVTAKYMRWHDEHNKKDGVMCHPSDRTNPSFALEARNVRLRLCTDGFQPFGQSGKQYSCWPIIVTPYNLPPWMCMKEAYMFLTIIVLGPRNPKQKLDVYLQPLLAELKDLWEVGVLTYDVSKRHNFLMRAALMWTISDFPAYAMLSGWSTAGKKACPYCMDKSKAFSLLNGGKVSWFDCHHQFLPEHHTFIRNKNDFMKNRIEDSPSPLMLTGKQVLKQIEDLKLKKVTDLGVEQWNAPICKSCGWNKRSIFWDLPYWSTNLVRHNLDVMHIEKNVFENVFDTVMDVEGKTKDNAKSREDIKIYCKHKELEKNDSTGKYPKACYSLSTQEKKVVCDWVTKLKFPDGYVSNMVRCVDMHKYKLFGMKSHDCHVFMQQLIPIAFRELLPMSVWKALTELSLFFKDLTCTVIKEEDMIRLQENIPMILCKLERIFPPSFFDSMEHLPIHLPYEARVGGPVQYRWMYTFERFLRQLKLKVTNKARVEGSICNAYLVQEVSTFCSHYFEPHINTKLRKVPRNDDGGEMETCEGNLSIFTYPGRSYGRQKSRWLTDEEYNAAVTYVLLNCDEIQHYVKIFVEELKVNVPNMIDEQVDMKLETEFANWFRYYVHDPNNNVTSQIIKDVALGPLRNVINYPIYFVNGFKFHTSDYSVGKSTINSGVCIKGSNYSELSSDYYGILKEIIELEYPALLIKKVVLFKCDWFDPTPNVGKKVHKDYNLVDINHKRRFNKYEPFILAEQALQVYYAPYPSMKRDKVDWWVVCRIKSRSVIEIPITNFPFQDDEVEVHSIDMIDDAIIPLNDSNGAFVDVDDGHDDVNLEDAAEPNLQETEMEDDEDAEDDDMSVDSE